MRVLAVDVGSTGVKAGVFEGSERKGFCRVGVESRMAGVEVEVPAEALLRVMEEAMRGAAESAGGGVDLIAVDVFSPGVVVWDRKGKVVAGCITHQDRRSVAEAWEIEGIVGKKRHLKMAGNRPFAGGIGSTSLRWLKKHRAGVLKEGCRVGQASSLVIAHLCGEFAIDPSHAAFLGLWDIRGKGLSDWNDELCAAAGVKAAWLPRLVWGDEIVGKLGAGVARRIGVKAGVGVVGGLVDTSAAVVATGMKVGQLVHNAGSTDVLALCCSKARPGEDVLTRPVGTGGSLKERWLAVSTIAASGAAVNWVRETMFAEMNYEEFEEVLREACKGARAGVKGGANDTQTTPPPAGRGGARGVSGGSEGVVFAPFLAGDRTSMEQVRGELRGLTLATGRVEILRGVVEGLVDANCKRVERLWELERVLPRVFTMGGRSELGEAMRRNWRGPGKGRRWEFVGIEGEALGGLVRLAEGARMV